LVQLGAARETLEHDGTMAVGAAANVSARELAILVTLKATRSENVLGCRSSDRLVQVACNCLQGRCSVPASPAIPAAPQYKNDKDYNQKRGGIHVSLLCVLSALSTALDPSRVFRVSLSRMALQLQLTFRPAVHSAWLIGQKYTQQRIMDL